LSGDIDALGWGRDWKWHRSWSPRQRVRNALCSSVFGPDAIAAVVIHGRSEIPGLDVGLLVDEHPNPWRGERSSIEIKNAIDMGIG
jgi:hypothetical protein